MRGCLWGYDLRMQARCKSILWDIYQRLYIALPMFIHRLSTGFPHMLISEITL